MAGVAAFSLSCSDATGPVATVSATVTRLTTGPQGSLDALDATLDVEMNNATSLPIRLASCAMSLERQNIEGEWEEVWSLACALITAGDPTLIPGGASRSIQVRITALGNGTSWPSGAVEGTYRLRLHFFPSDAIVRRMARVDNLVTAQAVVSNEFAFPAQ